MIDSFLDFIENGPDLGGILPFIGVYVLVVWLMFAVWAFKDARMRYENVMIPIGLFLLILPLNFPALVFYLIIRPETEEELMHHLSLFPDYESASQITGGGVNVPMVNFKGDNDFEISLLLRVNKAGMAQSDNKMVVDVKFEGDKLQSVASAARSVSESPEKQAVQSVPTTAVLTTVQQVDSKVTTVSQPVEINVPAQVVSPVNVTEGPQVDSSAIKLGQVKNGKEEGVVATVKQKISATLLFVPNLLKNTLKSIKIEEVKEGGSSESESDTKTEDDKGKKTDNKKDKKKKKKKNRR